MAENLLDRIGVNPQIMLGKPVIKGTRIPVDIILKKLADKISVREILRDYPRGDLLGKIGAYRYSMSVTFERALLNFSLLLLGFTFMWGENKIKVL